MQTALVCPASQQSPVDNHLDGTGAGKLSDDLDWQTRSMTIAVQLANEGDTVVATGDKNDGAQCLPWCNAGVPC